MITILGLGAIGATYAVSLEKAGFQVRIAVDKDRLEKYSKEPLLFNNTIYNFDYFTPSKGDQVAELIIIATKSTALKEALDLIEPIVGKETVILPLLNGITSEQITAQKFSWDKVLYGYFLGHTATRVGRSINQDGHFITAFGDAQNNPEHLSKNTLFVKHILEKAKIKYRIDEDMISSLWQKFVINIGLNQVTGLLNKNYGEIKSDSNALELMKNLMIEAQNVAIALNVKNAENLAIIGLETLSKMEGSDSSSMLQDVQAGRATEVDIFAGELCRLGKKVGVQTPLNEMVLEKLK